MEQGEDAGNPPNSVKIDRQTLAHEAVQVLCFISSNSTSIVTRSCRVSGGTRADGKLEMTSTQDYANCVDTGIDQIHAGAGEPCKG